MLISKLLFYFYSLGIVIQSTNMPTVFPVMRLFKLYDVVLSFKVEELFKSNFKTLPFSLSK